MKILNKEVGNFGEDLSKKYLKENGYIIIEENFSCPYGEIDIIALSDKYLCFMEVKTRYTTKFGLPLESITPAKQRKIIKTAQYFICKNKLFNHFCRFDALEV
ncbi:MAG: YraN family protein, partial [Clostridium sp.]